MLIDSHAHLDDERFAADVGDVLTRARAAGIGRIVTVGTGIASCERAIALAAENPELVSAAVGIDPHHADEADDEALARLAEPARARRVVAVGETGLEYHYEAVPREAQQTAFRAQIGLALEADLPLIIHCREAFDDTLRILRECKCASLRGVAHCFTGSMADAEAFLGLGFLLSFGGIVTFPNAKRLRAVAARVPLESILIETDSPYLAPQSQRGRRNEPAYVAHVADALAEVRGITSEEAARVTSANAMGLFGL